MIKRNARTRKDKSVLKMLKHYEKMIKDLPKVFS